MDRTVRRGSVPSMDHGPTTAKSDATTSRCAAAGIALPSVIFGTSALGNLYQAMPENVRRELIAACVATGRPTVLDCAGKYGAGLALEAIGRGLRALGVPPADVVISNKLGWLRVPLRSPEPTFEPGAWVGLEHDAEQRISEDGILACWRQGCELLGHPYRPQLVSVHDPDEYLARATDARDRQRRLEDIRGAYRSLNALKRAGEVAAVGIGAKDWRVIREITAAVEVDWVMLACSFTVHHHPTEVLELIADLRARGITVINSAVFHAGFLTGGAFFDYRRPDPADPADRELFAWRERFPSACREWGVAPAAACVRFAMSAPGVAAIALNTTSPARVAGNAALASVEIPAGFWTRLKELGLVRPDYPFLG